MKNKQYLIDIIIPIYNVNQYIEQCIASVINVPEINIIAVNDDSQEDPIPILGKYSHYKNFTVYHKENSGLSSARNFGLEKAQSEYIMFLDGDDYIDTEKFIECIKIIQETKKNAYYFGFKWFYPITNEYIKEDSNIIDSIDFISLNKEFIYKDSFIMVAWRFIIKREIILKNTLFFKEGIYHEDEEWTPRLLCSINKIYSLKQYLYMYRQRDNSITSNYNKKNIEGIFTVVNSLCKFRKTLIDTYQKEFIDTRILLLLTIIITSQVTKDNKEYFLNPFKQIQKNIPINQNKLLKSLVYKYGTFDIVRLHSWLGNIKGRIKYKTTQKSIY